MRISILISLLALCSSLTAQVASNTYSALDPFANFSLTKGVALQVEGTARSSAFNVGMYNDFLFRSGFSENNKKSFLSSTASNNNLDAQLITSLEFRSKRPIKLEYENRVLLRSNKDLSALVIFGNKPFEGKKVTSNDFRYLRYNRVNLKVGGMKGITHLSPGSSTGTGLEMDEGPKWISEYYIGLSVLTENTFYGADNISIFTANDGDYLDLSIGSGKHLRPRNGINGYGFTIDYSFKYQNKKDMLFGIELRNLSLYYLLENEIIEVDSTFRFQGFEVSPQNFDGDYFANFADSVLQGTVSRDTSSQILFLPTDINVFYAQKLNDKHSIQALIGITGLMRYGVHADVSHLITVSDKLLLRSSLSYGNFRGFEWTESAEYRISAEWQMHVSVVGINSMIAPRAFSAYGASVGIFKAL